MTREEAIQKIQNDLKLHHDYLSSDYRKSLRMAIEALQQPEQRWIPCGKCIHADGKHRWCKVLDRSINEDYFCYWAEPWKEGEV